VEKEVGQKRGGKDGHSLQPLPQNSFQETTLEGYFEGEILGGGKHDTGERVGNYWGRSEKSSFPGFPFWKGGVIFVWRKRVPAGRPWRRLGKKRRGWGWGKGMRKKIERGYPYPGPLSDRILELTHLGGGIWRNLTLLPTGGWKDRGE